MIVLDPQTKKPLPVHATTVAAYQSPLFRTPTPTWPSVATLASSLSATTSTTAATTTPTTTSSSTRQHRSSSLHDNNNNAKHRRPNSKLKKFPQRLLRQFCRIFLFHPTPAQQLQQQQQQQSSSPFLLLPQQSASLPLMAAASSLGQTTSAAMTTVTAAATRTASAAASTSSSSVGFFQLVMAFILGGLFFSTAIAAVSACYAVGLENVRVLWDIVKAIVQAVWSSFTAALSAAKAALLLRDNGNEKTKKAAWAWRSAWQVLKKELVKTRETAAQGVAALRQEASLYAGAVGVPGLIPLQYVVDRFLPFAIAGSLEQSLKESLAEMPKTRSINGIKLSSFSVGTRAPQLQAARAYELGDKGVAFDCDIDWPSELELKLTVYTVAGLARIPVVVRNVQFTGIVRVVFTPLVKDPPGYGAALVSFPKAPKINLDVRVAGGDITRIPWLRSELVSAIQKGIADELLWPKRVVVPTMNIVPSGPGGLNLREKPILSAAALKQLETTDPLLEREQELAESPMLRKQYEREPQLSSLRQQFKVFVNRQQQEINGNYTSKKQAPVEVQLGSPLHLNDSGGNSTRTGDHQVLLDSDKLKGRQRTMDPAQRRRLAKIQTGVLWQDLFQVATQAQD